MAWQAVLTRALKISPVAHLPLYVHTHLYTQVFMLGIPVKPVRSHLARPLRCHASKNLSFSAPLCMIVCIYMVCGCAGRWEARIGIPAKVYLGLFSMETEAAQAYDRALVRLRGTAAATNFALSDYRTDLAAYHKMQQVRMDSQVNVSPLAFTACFFCVCF